LLGNPSGQSAAKPYYDTERSTTIERVPEVRVEPSRVGASAPKWEAPVYKVHRMKI